jgi:hypothetical protein
MRRFLSLFALPSLLAAQSPDPVALRTLVRQYRTAHDVAILRELVDLLAIPNVASDSANIRANAARLVAMLERRGVSARLLESPGSPPAVYGELTVPRATRTVVLYAHYDGQPVSPEQWASPPWTPVLRDRPLEDGGREIPLPDSSGTVQGEWRLYARSASDDKAPIVAMLAALDALRAAGCRRAYVDGSFVTAKPDPGDFDGCWETGGVDPARLDPVLMTFDRGRQAQKAKYGGELFFADAAADPAGTRFVDFFQRDRTGQPKGIVALDPGGLP